VLKLDPLAKPALEALRSKLGLPRLTRSVFGAWMHSPFQLEARFNMSWLMRSYVFTVRQAPGRTPDLEARCPGCAGRGSHP